MDRTFIQCQIYAFITVLLWSTAYVFTPISLQYFTPGALGLIRCVVATLCLGLIVAVKKIPLPRASFIPWFVFSGLAGFSLYLLVFNIGAAVLNATTSCVMISTSPILTALLARAAFKEKLTASGWAATFLAFCGVLVMFLWDGTFMLSHGLVWLLGAALLISIYNILQRKLSRNFSAMQITASSYFWGTLPLLFIMPGTVGQLRSATPGHIALACFLGIFASAVAYLLWSKAISIAPKTSSVTNYMFLTPFLAMVLDYLVTGTVPGGSTFAGGGLILAGLLIFALTARR